MAVLTQTVTTETAINWEELAQKIKDNTSGLKVGDIITEKTLDGEEMDLVVVDMGPGWARFESKDCLPVEVAYNQNNRNAGGFAGSDVKRYLNEEVFNSLPEELRNVIAEVERKQENGESSLCRLFYLPSRSCSGTVAIQRTTHTARSNTTKTAATVSSATEKVDRLIGTGPLLSGVATRLIACTSTPAGPPATGSPATSFASRSAS